VPVEPQNTTQFVHSKWSKSGKNQKTRNESAPPWTHGNLSLVDITMYIHNNETFNWAAQNLQLRHMRVAPWTQLV